MSTVCAGIALPYLRGVDVQREVVVRVRALRVDGVACGLQERVGVQPAPAPAPALALAPAPAPVTAF